MTRRLFGGKSAVQDELGNVFSNQSNAGGVWNAASGGSAIVDLQNSDGSTASSVSTDLHGQFLFFGPDDGTSKVWVDFGFGRYEVEANDTTDRLNVIESDYLTQANLADITGFATTGPDGFVVDTSNNSWIPYVVRRVSGVWQLRSYYTQDATRTVIWRSSVDPTAATGYALPGDIWIDGNGALWLLGIDLTWHGGGGSGGSTSPPAAATLTTISTMGVTGFSGGVKTGVLFGASPGGTGATRMAAMVTTVGPNFVRSFESTPSTFGGNAQGQYVPAGVPQCNSVKPDLTVLSNSSATGYAAMVSQYRTYFAGMPAIPGQRAGCHHEPEGSNGAITDGSYTAAQFRQAQVNFCNDIIGFVNLSRGSNPIKPMVILQGFTLQSSSGRDITNYIDSTVLAALAANGGEVGFDIYNAAQISLAAAYSTANSIPWAIPEYGFSSSTAGTDAGIKGFMTSNTPGLKTMSNPPSFCCWFDGLENSLNTFMTSASLVSATTILVDALPGHTSAKDLPSGSAIRVDTTGTVDAVTTNADSAGSQTANGNPPLTVHVPALAHSHASGAVVEIKPLSAAQWKVYCT